MTTPKLRPCPFCGNPAVVSGSTACDCCNKPYNAGVYCTKCEAAITHMDSDAEAIAAWNTRTTRRSRK